MGIRVIRGAAGRLGARWRGVHTPAVPGTSEGQLEGADTPPLLPHLQARGFLHSQTSPGLGAHLAQGRRVLYAGFDPTAPSLHVGNLLAILALLHAQHRGHGVIALVGGATGIIGDPSGRTAEREPLAHDVLHANGRQVHAQLEHVFANGLAYMRKRQPLPTRPGPLRILNNLRWWQDMSLLEFMSHTGRYARLSTMLSRDSVKARLDSPTGISFTEFTYQLFQAHDFLHLYHEHGCTVQLGGSDQRGNIVAGLDLIRRRTNEAHPESRTKEDLAYGLTLPLVTTAQGEKFGKSAGNAIWLDRTMLAPLDFYQFFRRSGDGVVEGYLRLFTCLPEAEITRLMERHAVAPEGHGPQRALAREVTELVHGEAEAAKAEMQSTVLYDRGAATLAAADILSCFQGDARLVALGPAEAERLLAPSGGSASTTSGEDGDTRLVALFLHAGLVTSEREGRELLAAGGLYCNYAKLRPGSTISRSDCQEGRALLLRRGKETYRILHLL